MNSFSSQPNSSVHDSSAGKRSSTSSDKTLVFENDIQDASGHTVQKGYMDTTASFNNGYDKTSFSWNLSKSVSLNGTDHAPMFLFLRREGFANSTLCDAVTNEPIYHIRNTGRSSLSHEPDLIITRTRSGDVPIGSIKFNRKTTDVKTYSTGQVQTSIQQFKPSRPLQNQPHDSKLIWTTKTLETTPAKKYNWSKEDKNAIPTSKISSILVLELIDQAHPESPLCIVRLYDTQPTGRFEIWHPSACVNRVGGDWAVLDEFVLSAYANMETARLDMRRKIDRLRDDTPPWEVALALLLNFLPG